MWHPAVGDGVKVVPNRSWKPKQRGTVAALHATAGVEMGYTIRLRRGEIVCSRSQIRQV